MYKKDLKLSTAIILSGIMLTAALPGFAQDSSYSQNYGSGYGQGYSSYQGQSYNNQNYGPGPGQGQGQGSYQPSYNQGGYGGGYGSLPPLQGRVATAPAGTQLEVTLSSAISSSISNVGDMVSTRLNSDLSMGGNLVLPAGSQIEGQVTESQKAGLLNKSGKLSIHFTDAVTPNGMRVPLSARIANDLKGGSFGNTMKKSAEDTAIGAAGGAIAGTILGPLGGGRVGRGAVYGTAVGAGTGLLGSFVTKGNDVTIPAGSKINIVLDQPLTVNTSASSGGY